MPDTKKQNAAELPVLIVDDEEIVLVALRDTLLFDGYQVVATTQPAQALQFLKEREFFAIISDQQMPGMTGLEFLAQVKQIQPDATRILVTAVLNLGTMIDAINKGEIFRFIVKPWLREELQATLQNAWQRFNLVRSNARLLAEATAMNEKLTQLNQALETQLTTVAEQNRRLASLASTQDDNLQRLVQLCAQTMQTFYPMLGSQARRVFEICKTIGHALQLSPEQQSTLEIAAWIHDIGLVGVPRQLIKRSLEEPHTLTDDERALIQHHPVQGEELARFAHPLAEVGPVIRAHHERYDGGGYPDRLIGESIPWLARLLAAAVAYAEYDLEPKAAAEMISRGSGTAFDPEAVRVLLGSLPLAVVPGKQREVLLSDLRPGMVLAQGIYTATGILLMPDGQQLTPTTINKLLNHHRINPISESLLVYC